MQDTITKRLQEASGLEHDAAARLVAAIIRTLLEQLSAHDRMTLLRKLPASVAALGRDVTGAASESIAAFHARVGAQTALPDARVVEATQVVCAALSELLDADARAWLAARVPSALSEWLTPREHAPHIAEPPHGSHRPPTLAEGRPGSTHPLSESRTEAER